MTDVLFLSGLQVTVLGSGAGSKLGSVNPGNPATGLRTAAESVIAVGAPATPDGADLAVLGSGTRLLARAHEPTRREADTGVVRPSAAENVGPVMKALEAGLPTEPVGLGIQDAAAAKGARR